MKLVGRRGRWSWMGLRAVAAIAAAAAAQACNERPGADARAGSSSAPATSSTSPQEQTIAPAGGSTTPPAGGMPSSPPATSSPTPAPSGASGAEAARRGACQGRWRLGRALTVAPAAAGQSYVRCATAGSERLAQVTLSPGGDRLAARTTAGTVRLYAVDAGWRELAQLAAPVGQISFAAFSPDGARLVTEEEEMGETTVWRAADGTLERSFAGPPPSTIDGGARAVAFSSDGARLATGFGTVIDLATGGEIDWTTAQPVTFERRANPANLSPGGLTIVNLRFAPAAARLFVDARSQTGNSPTSAELSLFSLGAAAPRSLYPRMFERALAGYALSRDGALVAVAATPEAAVAGAPVGLHLYRTATGEEIAADGGFAGGVLGFSPDGASLFVTTAAGDAVRVLDAGSLQESGSFPWPVGARFLGVSPAGLLVAAAGGKTSWFAPDGYQVRSVSYVLSDVSWTADGTRGAGVAEDGALFHLWRESEGTELCAPMAAPEPPAGVTLSPTSPEPLASGDGAVLAQSEVVIHAHAQDWFALRLTAAEPAGAGAVLRVFGAAGGQPQRAAFSDGSARLYTEVAPGTTGSPLAVWCR